MTNIKRILLTGDDGYNSIGTRLLIHTLKEHFDLQVIATRHQQSAVGGKLSLATGGTWGETTIDGVPAIWVEGSPADAMEFARVYCTQPFDLILSGINLGLNGSSGIVSSGTFSAAIRGMGLGLAPKGMALSYGAPMEVMLKKHDENEALDDYLQYPGAVLKPLFDLIFQEKMWGVDLLNVNFPGKPTNTIRFTKIHKDINKMYDPIMVDEETHRFSYEGSDESLKEDDLRYDVGALKHGHISITPCAFDVTHFTTFEKMKDTQLTL